MHISEFPSRFLSGILSLWKACHWCTWLLFAIKLGRVWGLSPAGLTELQHQDGPSAAVEVLPCSLQTASSGYWSRFLMRCSSSSEPNLSSKGCLYSLPILHISLLSLQRNSFSYVHLFWELSNSNRNMARCIWKRQRPRWTIEWSDDWFLFSRKYTVLPKTTFHTNLLLEKVLWLF